MGPWDRPDDDAFHPAGPDPFALPTRSALPSHDHSVLLLWDVRRLSYPMTISGSPHFGIRPFSQSDEISLLFGPDSDGFGRKLRKLLSILSGEASARFSLLLGAMAVFDCRISQLPSVHRPVPRLREAAHVA